MSKKEDARRNGQVLAFGTAVLNSLPRELSPKEMKYWVGHQGELAERFREREVFASRAKKHDIKKPIWSADHNFYHEILDLEVDLSQIATFPPEQDSFNWLVVIPRELGDQPLNTAIAACRKLFKDKVWTHADDMDKAVTRNNRDPRRDGSYAIRVRDRQEADEELNGLSANDIRFKNMVTMTLLERIILELFHFWKTGEHLDIRGWTLCTGSRYSGGGVPECCWSIEGFKVGCCSHLSCSPRLRARSAII